MVIISVTVIMTGVHSLPTYHLTTASLFTTDESPLEQSCANDGSCPLAPALTPSISGPCINTKHFKDLSF